MNSDSFKKQADRLKDFLGKHHRVNLSHSSALTAVAAVHGARNWQSLIGAETKEACSIIGESPSSAKTGDYALTWENGTPNLKVSQEGWRRHTFVTGEASVCRAWYDQQLEEHARKGRGGAFFLSGTGNPPAVYEVSFGERAANSEATPRVGYSLLKGLSSLEATEVLMKAYLARTDLPAQSQSRDRCKRILHAIINAVCGRDGKSSAELTLSSVVACLTVSDPAVLRLLPGAKNGSGPTIQEALADFGDECASKAAEQFCSSIHPLVDGLRQLSRSRYAETMFCERPGAVSIIEALAEGKLLEVGFQGASPHEAQVRQMWLAVVTQFAARRSLTGSSLELATVTVAFDDYVLFKEGELTQLLREGRKFGFGLLLVAGDLGPSKQWGDAFLRDNVRNHLNLGTPAAAVSAEMVRLLFASSAQLCSGANVSY